MLIRQDEPPGDVFVLESGRLRVEMVTPEGTRMRLRTVLPGVVVGEIAMYTGTRARPMWWPRRRAWCCGSAERRSSGWSPRSRRWPRRCTDGSPRRCPSG